MKTTKKIQKTLKAFQLFLNQIYKNYQSMKKKIKTIWALVALCLTLGTLQSCDVSRVVTNQSEYYHRGDTAVVIQTKTIETYNAERK